MRQYEMRLPDSLAFGSWTIYTNSSAGKDSKDYRISTTNFDVEKYVLPTFEVTITPPSFVLKNAPNITTKICGKYTYGKMVKGNLIVEATYESYSYWYSRNYPKTRHEQKIEGCIDFTIQEEALNWTKVNRYRPVQISARIVEDGTEVEQNSKINIEFAYTPINVQFKNPSSYSQNFKPKMLFQGEVLVTNPDNTPRPNELMQLCYLPTTQELTDLHHRTDTYLFCKNFTTDDKGIIPYTLLPYPGNVVNINIQADAVNRTTQMYDDNSVMYSQPTTTQTLKPWSSLANRYIQITSIKDVLVCDSTQLFTVYLNGEDGDNITLFYQVMSGAGISSSKTVTYEYSKIKAKVPMDDTFITKTVDTGKSSEAQDEIVLGVVRVPVEVTPDIAPTAHLIVYYVYNGELIADFVNLQISKCLRNKVGMEFSNSKQLPGTDVNLKVTASPNSLCGIGAVDKSVSLLRSSNQLTPDTVFDLLNSGISYMEGYFEPQYSCIPSGKTGTSSFLRRKRSVSPPYKVTTSYKDSLNVFQSGKLGILSDLTMVTKPCSSYYTPYYRAPEAYASEEFITTPGMMFTSAAGATFEFGMDSVGSDEPEPKVKVRSNFPESWLWEMNYANVSGVLVKDVQLPDTITEWVATAVCLHSEAGLGVSPPANVTTFQPFFVTSTMPYSVIRGETLPLVVTVFNYLQECLPVTVKLDDSKNFQLINGTLEQNMCICGENSVSFLFLIKPKVLGRVDFTYRAYTNAKNNACSSEKVSKTIVSDGATKSILVQSEGFPQQKAFSNFVCLSNNQEKFQVNYSLAVPNNNTVLDSVHGELVVYGDLMGPSLHNVKNLMSMPYGCGEQNMVTFMPDIFILDYLNSTGQLTKDIQESLLSYIRTGYQNELSYRRGDGSYSAFGRRDDRGSNWLSAFVVKGYQAASKYIYVDRSEIMRTLAWIMAHQDDDGCFSQVGDVHDVAMQGGSRSNLGSKATLTSYIMASVLEADLPVNNTDAQRAITCLHKEHSPTAYTSALMAYTFCLAKDPAANQFLQNVLSLAKSDGDVSYWEDDSTHSLAIQIETSAYVLLADLTCKGEGYLEKALPMVRWIAGKINPSGSFASTQDTVVALQALSKYSSHFEKSVNNIDMTVHAEGVNTKFHMDESSKLLLQTVQLPSIPTNVTIQGSGTGCALLQAKLFYNVMTPTGFHALYFNVTTVRKVKNDCKKAEVIICMSYNYQNEYSKMVVLEISLPSGYGVNQESIEQLRDDSQLHFRRSDIKDNNLSLYFSKVSSEKICFSVILDQNIEVHNLQPSIAKLYEYYQPEDQVSQPFTIDENCKSEQEP